MEDGVFKLKHRVGQVSIEGVALLAFFVGLEN